MRKLIYVLIISVVMIFGLTFVFKNQQMVTVDYYGAQVWGFSWEVQLSVLIIATFVTGLVIGNLFSTLSNLRLRSRLMSTNRKLKQAEEPHA
jgi:uncharacterized membrane protein YciS (DUF1049 family)